jgi:predicted GIY-YIG superfamily endonuclease
MDKNQATYYVYCLSDPRTYKPRYVGVTKDLTQRYSSHVGHFYTKGRINAKLSTWFNDLELHNLTPQLVVLDEIQGLNKALAREAMYISVFQDFGNELCNIMSSGKKNHKLTY